MQDNPNDKKIIVVGKKSPIKKYLAILFLLLLIVIALVYYALSLMEDDNQAVVRPTVIPTSTIKLEVSPTISEGNNTPSPTSSVISSQKYIFPDCEIELLAGSQWISSTKGYLGTCGILSTEEMEGFWNLTDYTGTLIAILPFLNDSPFAPEKPTTYEDYLERIDKEANRYSPIRDFLYSREDYQVDYRPAVITEIYKAKLGMTKQVFYTGFRGEYIILWGGQTADSMEEDVMNVIESIKFRQALPGEEEE